MLVHVRTLMIGYVGIMPVIPRPRAMESHGFYVKKESFSTRTEAVRRERYFKTGRVRDELAVLNCRTVAAATGRGFKSRRPEILLCPGTQTFSLCAQRSFTPADTPQPSADSMSAGRTGRKACLPTCAEIAVLLRAR